MVGRRGDDGGGGGRGREGGGVWHGGGGGGGVCSDVARRVASFMRATACLMGILVGEGL